MSDPHNTQADERHEASEHAGSERCDLIRREIEESQGAELAKPANREPDEKVVVQ